MSRLLRAEKCYYYCNAQFRIGECPKKCEIFQQLPPPLLFWQNIHILEIDSRIVEKKLTKFTASRDLFTIEGISLTLVCKSEIFARSFIRAPIEGFFICSF